MLEIIITLKRRFDVKYSENELRYRTLIISTVLSSLLGSSLRFNEPEFYLQSIIVCDKEKKALRTWREYLGRGDEEGYPIT